MAATAMILAPGETLGGYRILDVIGIGGMSIVYRAEQLSLGREVALKVMACRDGDDEEFVRWFRREGRSVARLDHPNIIAIHDAGEENGRMFLAMRLVSGATLADRIRAGGLTVDETLTVVTPIADALDTAHLAGIVHRDVKPQNILIGATGHAYLADFGIAKGITTAGVTQTRGFVGSYNYAAPEQILGQRVSPATDIYALTAVLYHCFTGQPPYVGDTDAAVLHAQAYEPPPTIARDTPGADQFNTLIARGMAKAPEDRFGNAGALLREANEYVRALPSPHRPASPTLGRNHRSNGVGVSELDGEIGHVRGRETTTATSAGALPSVSPDRRQARRVRRLALGVSAVIAALVIGVGAILLGSGGAPAAPEQFTAKAVPFKIRYERPWRATGTDVVGSAALSGKDSASTIGRPAATGPVQLASGSATLAAGELVSSSPIPAGAPPALVRHYGQPAATVDARIDGHRGREYVWLAAGRSLVAFVLPAWTRDAAIICQAPTAATAAMRSCRALAQDALVFGVRAVSPGPDVRLARNITSAVGPVRVVRTSIGRLSASTLSDRANGADRVAKAEATAAQTLSRFSPAPRYERVVRGLRSALEQESAAFNQLYNAARTSNRAGYAKAGTDISGASKRVENATRAFASYQLPVHMLNALHLDAPPPLQQTGGTSGVAQVGTVGSATSSAPLPGSGASSGASSGSGNPSTGGHQTSQSGGSSSTSTKIVTLNPS